MTQDPTRHRVLTLWVVAIIVLSVAAWMSDKIAGR